MTSRRTFLQRITAALASALVAKKVIEPPASAAPMVVGVDPGFGDKSVIVVMLNGFVVRQTTHTILNIEGREVVFLFDATWPEEDITKAIEAHEFTTCRVGKEWRMTKLGNRYLNDEMRYSPKGYQYAGRRVEEPEAIDISPASKHPWLFRQHPSFGKAPE